MTILYYRLLDHDEGWEKFKASFGVDEELFNSILGNIDEIDIQVKLIIYRRINILSVIFHL